MTQSLKDLIPTLAQVTTKLANDTTKRNKAELRSRILAKFYDKTHRVVLSFLIDIFGGNSRDLGKEIDETIQNILLFDFHYQLLTDILK